MPDNNTDPQFSLIITNLSQENKAIIARQDKIETIINGQQVLLATLVEQHRNHEDDMKSFAEAIKDLHKDASDTSKILSSFATQMNVIKLVGSSVLTLAVGYAFAHFVK